MSAPGLQLSYAEQEQLAQKREKLAGSMSRREFLTLFLTFGAFLMACGGLWLLPHTFNLDVLPALIGLLVFVFSTRVQFETSMGFTSPLQLAFVPLMFLVPPVILPLVVTFGFVLSALPEIAGGTWKPSRLLHMVTNGWFAMGPAYVFILTKSTSPVIWVFLVALAAQFLSDFIPASLKFTILEHLSLREIFRDLWVYVVDLGLSGLGFAVAIFGQKYYGGILVVVPLVLLLKGFAKERKNRLNTLLELNETYRGTAMLLGDVVEADDEYTGQHSQGVVALAKTVGEKMDLTVEQKRNLEFAALLHDVGKVTIPKEIINKPGKLTDEEFELIKTHPAAGEEMLQKIGGFMNEVGSIVRAHHERWDGRGYPDKLTQDQVPLESRIITACDSWSAMRTNRPYREAMSYEDAVAEIENNIGSQFDPQVARALLEVVAEEQMTLS